MYNQKLKQDFINFKKINTVINEGMINSYFEQCSWFEEMKGKDLAEFSLQEAYEMYKIIGFDSMKVINVFNSNMAQYTQYCLDRGLVGRNQNVYREITSDIKAQCINQSLKKMQVITRKNLLDMIRKLENPRERFVILCVFEFGTGSNFEDIAYLKIEDIDKDNHVAYLHSGRKVEISDKLIDLAYECGETEKYSTPLRTFNLFDDGTIIKQTKDMKGIRSDHSIRRTVYSLLSKSLKQLNLSQYISSRELISSGQIHMITTESSKYGLSPEDFIRNVEYRKRVENQYGINKMIIKTFLQEYGDFL